MLFKQHNIKNTNKHNFIMSPVLKGRKKVNLNSRLKDRQKVNLATRKLFEAKKKDKTTHEIVQNGPHAEPVDIVNWDFAGKERIKKAKLELKKEVTKRKLGLSGLQRKRAAGTKKMSRVININKLRNPSVKGYPLVKAHPRLRGIRSGDLITTVSASGNIRTGTIVAADQTLIYLRMQGETKPVMLYLNNLDKIKKI
jgi:hypothetical protein